MANCVYEKKKYKVQICEEYVILNGYVERIHVGSFHTGVHVFGYLVSVKSVS